LTAVRAVRGAALRAAGRLRHGQPRRPSTSALSATSVDQRSGLCVDRLCRGRQPAAERRV